MDFSDTSAFFELFPDPCGLIDRSWRLRRANAPLRALIGPVPAEGVPLSDIVDPDSETALRAVLYRLELGHPSGQVTARLRGGDRPLHWHFHRASAESNVQLILRRADDLHEAALRLPAVEAVSGVGTWAYDPETAAVHWSDMTARIHDRAAGGDIAVDEALSHYLPESRAIIDAALSRLMQDGTPYDYELQISTAKGRIRWVRATGGREERSGRLPLIYGTFQDVTNTREERDLLARLAEERDSERNRLRATLDALPDDLFELDAEGRFVDYHARRADDLVIPPEQFLGKRMEDVLPPDVVAVGQQAMAEIAATGRSSGLRYAIEKDGQTRWFELSASARQAEDGGFVFLARDVSDRVKAESNLRERDALLQAFFDLSPVGMTISDLGGNQLIDANPAFLQATGLTVQDLQMRFPARIIVPLAEDVRAGVAGSLAEKGRYGPIAASCYRADGTTYPVRISGVILNEASGRRLLWSMIEDVREQQEHEDRLRAAERFAVMARQQLLTAVDSLSDGFVLYDSADRLVLANESYRRLYAESGPVTLPGVRFEEIVRFCLAQGDYPEAEGREEAFFKERMAQHRAVESTSQQRLRDGRVVRIRERMTPDGGRVGLHVVITDIHDAREAAEEASRAKSAFLAHMSHEIRTPLAGILGMTDLLIDRIAEPDQKALAEAVHQSGETLLTILNDLLDMSKIEAGKLELEQATFRPDELAQTVAALYALRAESKHLEFRLDCAEGTDRPRLGDPHRITQILHNLLSNALKFTDTGSLSLSVSALPDRVSFRVEDTGIGMTPDQRERMLRPFEQATPDISRRYGGTGLGMSIVVRLVEMMGGELTVESRFGQGTAVLVNLPLPEVASLSASSIRPSIDLRGLRVLAADDNEINRRILEGYLRLMDVEVTLASDGQQALELYEAGRFDVLCLDISMPVLDGIAALQLIRAKAHAQGAEPPPAIAITSNAMTHQVADYLAAGFAAHVGKPFRRDDLARTLARVVRPAKAQAGNQA